MTVGLDLIIPSFIAGVLTFLAPCTLPLTPAYLGFISGLTAGDLEDREKLLKSRMKIFINGVFYVIGFSLVFIVLGSLVGLGGAALFKYRLWLSRIGGLFVIIFGLVMIRAIKFDFLLGEKHLNFPKIFKPGHPLSSLLLGGTFAFGWTPCVGPILGTVLTLAATSATVFSGMILLTVFSLGLAIPFLLAAALIGSSSNLLKATKYLNLISVISGVFLIFIGILLLTNSFGLWISFMYSLFNFINYEGILKYL